MNSKHFLSSGAFRTRQLGEIVESCVAEGITNLELSSGIAHNALLPEMVEGGRKSGLTLRVHNYFPPPAQPFVLNLAAVDPVTRALSMDHCRAAIDLSAKLGAPYFSVHAGFLMRLKPEELGDAQAQSELAASFLATYDDAYGEFVPAVRSLCEYADLRGLDFLVENNVASPTAAQRITNAGVLLARPEELKPFFEDVSHPRAGLLVDVGHAKVSATALAFDKNEFLAAAAPYVRAFHLSDNSGQADENAMFTTEAWFASFVGRYPDAEKVIEVYRLSERERQDQIAVLESMTRTNKA